MLKIVWRILRFRRKTPKRNRKHLQEIKCTRLNNIKHLRYFQVIEASVFAPATCFMTWCWILQQSEIIEFLFTFLRNFSEIFAKIWVKQKVIRSGRKINNSPRWVEGLNYDLFTFLNRKQLKQFKQLLHINCATQVVIMIFSS